MDKRPEGPANASQAPSSTSQSNGNRQRIPSRQAIALILVHADPASEIGKGEAWGQNTYVRQVGEALERLGWQVDMFTRKTSPEAPTIVQHSPHCRTIRLVAGPQEPVHRDRLFDYLPEFVEAFKKFQTKETANYPLVHTNYWLGGWVGLQLKQHSNIQLVHTFHSLGSLKYQGVAEPPDVATLRMGVERQILEAADRVIATSPQEQEYLWANISANSRVNMIPCGADMASFHTIPKEEARRALGISADERVVLYVGRFEPYKGIETLVKAFARLKHENLIEQDPDALKLMIVGDSDPDSTTRGERQRIAQQVRDLNLQSATSFAGRVGHDRLPLYYTAADVCVVPSHFEPFGLVAIEAMACGTPVVASDVGGLRFTVIPEETGLLAPPRDDVAFSDAIARILNDPQWATKMTTLASARVQQNFSWAGIAGQLSNLYRHLLAESIMHGGTPMMDASRWQDPALAAPVETLTKAS